MKRKTYSKRLFRILFTVLFTLSLPIPCYAELTVESYCQVAIEIAEQQTSYLTELLPLTDKYCEDPNFWAVYSDDPNSFIEEKAVLKKKLDDQRASLFSSFNTTAVELYAFEDENQDAIAEYLNNNPDTEQTIGSLLAGINALTNKLKVPYYCLAVVASAKQEIRNINELIALAQQYSNDKDLFLAQEQAKRVEHDAVKEALFESFDRTANEYLAFMSKNAKAVEQYLVNHPTIKDTINNLPNQVIPLLEQYEGLRQSIINEPGGPVPPVP